MRVELLDGIPMFPGFMSPPTMDYKGYLDFVIAHEHRSHPAAQAYFFRALDLRACGALSVFDINFFVRDIVQGLLDQDEESEPPGLVTIVDEIFDLAKSRAPGLGRGPGSLERERLATGELPVIRLKELEKCGAGSIILQCLIDVQGFWNWDNREQLIEYDDDDRYEKDTREQARAVTKLFSEAAKAKACPLLAELISDDESADSRRAA